jgi:O-antigen/teichoic acid export membrane protein
VASNLFSTIKQLGTHSIIYGFGGLASKILGLILLPLYTRYLTPEDYGAVSLLLLTESIFLIIGQLGIGSALFREVIYKGEDEATVESTALYFLLLSSALVFFAAYLFSSNLSRLIFGTSNYADLFRIVFLTGFLEVFGVVFFARLRIREQSTLYAAMTPVGFLLGVALNIYFIAYLHRGVEGLLGAQLIQSALLSTLYLGLLAYKLRLVFSFTILQSMLSFGVPLIPANLSSLIMTSADRYFLNHFSTTTEVGIYSLGYNIGLVANLAVQALQLAWPTQMFRIAKEPGAERQFARILTYYWFVMGFIVLAISVLARELLIVLTTPAFYPAYSVVPLIAFSYLLYGTRFMTTIGMLTKNKTKYSSFIIVLSAAINLGLSYLLIPRFGLYGAAWATFISYFVLVIINILVDLRLWYIPYEYLRLAKIALAWAIIYIGSLSIQTTSIWLNIGLKVFWISSFPLLLYAVRFYTLQEKTIIKMTFYTLVEKINYEGGNGIHIKS